MQLHDEPHRGNHALQYVPPGGYHEPSRDGLGTYAGSCPGDDRQVMRARAMVRERTTVRSASHAGQRWNSMNATL